MKQLISGVIVARNAGTTLHRCLSSLSSIAEVVVLIDEATTDDTAQIAESFPNTVIAYTAFEGFGRIKQKAAAMATHDWVFSIDADEMLSTSLINFLSTFSPSPDTVYAIKRHNHYRDRHIDACGWNNDYPIRFFNKKTTGFNDAHIHESVISKGLKVVKINDPILHYPYQNEEQLREKAVRYARLYAQENFRKKSASPRKALWKSAVTFIKDYFLRKGWLFGADGFTIAKYNALGAQLKYQYLYEQNKSLGISLIISTYNRPDALARVLESVCLQSRKPNQVIIADDGSTTETAEVINAFKSKIPSLLHVWHEDTGFRLAAIRNLALRHVNHDFVSMIDGDMVLHPDFIQNIDNHVQKGWYYQGKRVLLNPDNTQRVLNNPNYQIGFFTSGIQNRFNTLNFPLLSKWLSRIENTIRGVKGCSMHFWLEDAIRINGFNESFIGWGREDSEFVCRLLNAGIKRKNIALGAVAWHLYHPEASRKMLPENDAILEKCISEKHTFTPTGIRASEHP